MVSRMDAERVRRAWSQLLGVSMSAFDEDGIVVVEHADRDTVVVVTMGSALWQHRRRPPGICVG